MKQYKVFVVANLIFGVLLIVLTKLILPVCHPIDGGTMSCEISTTVDAFLGLALLANAVAWARKGPSGSLTMNTLWRPPLNRSATSWTRPFLGC